MTRLALLLAGVLGCAMPLAAQSDAAATPFEVASVKRNVSGSLQRRIAADARCPGDRPHHASDVD